MYMLSLLNNKKCQPLVKKRGQKHFTGNLLFSMDVAIYRPTEGGQGMVIRRRGTSLLGSPVSPTDLCDDDFGQN